MGADDDGSRSRSLVLNRRARSLGGERFPELARKEQNLTVSQSRCQHRFGRSRFDHPPARHLTCVECFVHTIEGMSGIELLLVPDVDPSHAQDSKLQGRSSPGPGLLLLGTPGSAPHGTRSINLDGVIESQQREVRKLARWNTPLHSISFRLFLILSFASL